MYTKFKPWKQTPQISETPDEKVHASQQPRANRRQKTETFSLPSLQFVNTSHPRQATSVEVIGTIRSHVAKEIHATRRQRRRPGGGARAETKPPADRPKSLDCTTKGLVDFKNNLDVELVAGYEGQSPRQPTELPSPTTLLDTARRDQLNSFARPLNDAESFIIDHYLTVVWPEAFSQNSDSKVYSAWVPFALSDTGLLSAVLLVTCGCLELLNNHGWCDSPYAKMVERYKGDCLRSIINALTEEGPSVSGTTMARVMVMCSYELKFGDNSTAHCHAKAITKMVELKGGLKKVSTEDYAGGVVAGFCSKLETWSGNSLQLPVPDSHYEGKACPCS